MRRTIGMLIGFLFLGLAAHCVAADVPGTQELLAKDLDPLARKIYEFLKEEQESAVRIAEIVCANNELDSTNGNLVKLALADALREQKVTIKRQAKATITGEIEFIAEDKNQDDKNDLGKLYLKLKARITNRAEEDFKPAFEITNDIVKPVLLGSNWAAQGGAASAERNDQAADDAYQRISIQGTPSPPPIDPESNTKIAQGDYAVELAVRPRGKGEYVARAVKVGDGQDLNAATPYVPIDIDEEYEIRIYNKNTRFDAAAEILIDGVNSLYFFNVEKENASPSHQPIAHWLVPRGGSMNLAGWQRNNAQAERFIVKKFSETVASELGLKNSDEKVGTVTVILYSAWLKGEAGDLSGTGRGDTFENKVETQVRNFGPVKAILTLRYALPD